MIRVGLNRSENVLQAFEKNYSNADENPASSSSIESYSESL